MRLGVILCYNYVCIMYVYTLVTIINDLLTYLLICQFRKSNKCNLGEQLRSVALNCQ